MTKVLVVDDQLTILTVVTRRLKKLGLEIHTAQSGPQALEQASVLKPDLVLMDMHMPMMDGFTAVQKLREQGYAGKIAALTASAKVSQLHRSMEAGCDDFITKPLPPDFEERVQALLA